ncbi:hypothetical protein ACP275_11G040500 [Erythranthe tilingii]
MGKRKRTADNNKAPPPPPDFIPPHAPQEGDLRKSSDLTESSATQSLASIMDAMDKSVKKSPAHQSRLSHHNHPIMSRHSRHPPMGRHYSRRSSDQYPNSSPSNSKATPLMYDALSSFKLQTKKHPSAFTYRDGGERMFRKPERIRSGQHGGGVSGILRKMECRICKKRLRKTPFVLDNSMPLNDVSVVAVLVCGHMYHADCLEQETGHQDRWDPPCPVCAGHVS